MIKSYTKKEQHKYKKKLSMNKILLLILVFLISTVGIVYAATVDVYYLIINGTSFAGEYGGTVEVYAGDAISIRTTMEYGSTTITVNGSTIANREPLWSGSYTFSEGTHYVALLYSSGGMQTVQTITVVAKNKDSTAPTVTLSASPSGWTNGSVTLTGTYQDSGMGTNGYTFSTSSSVSSYTAITATTSKGTKTKTITDEGKVIWYFHARDANNNTSKTSTTVYIDKTAPTAGTMNMTSNGATYTSGNWATANVSLTKVNGSDALSGHSSTTYTINGTASTATSISTEGTSTIVVTTKDNAGNSASRTYTVRLDKTKPSINSLTASTTAWTNANITLTGKAQDTTSGITAYAFTTTNATPSSWIDVTDSTAALTHNYTASSNTTYYYWVKDVAGNVNSQSIVVGNIDKIDPTISSYTISVTATNQQKVTVTLKATDDLSGVNRVDFYACTGNGSAGSNRTKITGTNSNGTYTATFEINNIVDAETGSPPGTEGTYYFDAWVYDNAGNDVYQSALTTVYDTLAPINPSVIINNDAKYTNSRNVTLTLSASDNLTGVSQVAISNAETVGTYQAYATTKSWTLTDGSGVKTVYVIYKDAAGNATAGF